MEFVLFTERADEGRVEMLKSLTNFLSTQNTIGAMAEWEAECVLRQQQAAKDKGSKLTDEEMHAIRRIVWASDIESKVTDRWGYVLVSFNGPVPNGKYIFKVAPDATADEVYESFWSFWDYLNHEYPKADVLRPLVEQAAAEGQKHRYTVGRTMKADELLQFVRGWMGRTVFTLEDVGSDAGMVFMPLSFGIFNLPKETPNPIDALVPTVGPEPPCPPYPPKPAAPHKPKRAPKPQQPTLAEPDATLLAELNDLSWDDHDEAERRQKAHYADLKQRNEAALQQWRQAVAAWEADEDYSKALQAWQDKCDAAKAAYKKLQAQHAKDVAAWKVQHAAWHRDEATARLVSSVFDSVRLADIGTIWADTQRDYTLPRGINGLPMFSECHVMSKADYIKARKLIDAEFKHQAEQKALLEQEMP